ncbi:hypothetical protein LT85_2350 [Collimonas arenae]|uniref:Uncharacterized protein n=1 Tax=Collimonas arenae TaxID=279058 RepID=A0A0A1F9T2_9BURK|nr:hypothetical protein [Collimonas arenae]AIY41508.1 hypothetical protein LT85_2350 [Collimonas arenae]
MKKILLVLLLGTIAAGLPGQAIADSGTGIGGQAPIFAPPALYGAETHPAPLFLAPPAMTIAPVWRQRNEWEKRRVDQWSELEWQRQQWRETHNDSTVGNRLNTSTSQGPASSNSF